MVFFFAFGDSDSALNIVRNGKWRWGHGDPPALRGYPMEGERGELWEMMDSG